MVAGDRKWTDDIRFRVRYSILESPRLSHYWLERRPHYADRFVSARSDLVIDGFPRSANSYAWHALRMTLGEDVRVSGHTHSVQSLARAVECGIPAIMIIRPPQDAVASLLQMRYAPRPHSALRHYIRFYELARPLVEGLCVATFQEVVSDFGAVLSRVNRQFSTSFPVYEKTPDNEARLNGRLEEAVRRRHAGRLEERAVSRPSSSRLSAEQVVAKWDDTCLRLLDTANATHHAILDRRGVA